MGISNLSFSATNINVGLDADKITTPSKGSMYLATDTEILYRCFADDTWTSDELTEVTIDGVKPNISIIKSGSFLGDQSVNKAIAHGLGKTPKYIVALSGTGSGSYLYRMIRSGYIYATDNTNEYARTVTAWDSTNFYVGNSGNYNQSMNDALTYYWVAFG